MLYQSPTQGHKLVRDNLQKPEPDLRQRLVDRFGDGCILQPTKDPELKSGLVAFTPFADRSQRRDSKLSEAFEERMFKEHLFHMGMGGLDSRGLTRAPSPDTAAFFSHCIPNRHPVTNAPEPSDIPFRASTGVWLTRRDIDVFVDACEETAKKLGAR